MKLNSQNESITVQEALKGIEKICIRMDVLFQESKEEFAINSEDPSFDMFVPNSKYESQMRLAKLELVELLGKLYQASIRENYYYFDCPLKVYEHHFLFRKQTFLNENPDASEIDFLKSELEFLVDPEMNRRIDFRIDLNLYYHDYIEHKGHYQTSHAKKIEFLYDQIDRCGFEVVNKDDVVFDYRGFTLYSSEIRPKESEVLQESNELIKDEDLLNKKGVLKKKNPDQLTGNQIVLLLNELGLFVNDRMSKLSNVKTARLVSLITGLSEQNIREHLGNLSKSPSKQRPNYQDDIDIVRDILEKL